jgi:hypothetical protein
MKQEQLKKLKNWFDEYVASFYGDDEFANANLKFKEDHSRRICDEMGYLVDQLKLNANQKLLALATALLHDIGRFEQFAKHDTYKDVNSEDHCLLSLEVLQKEKALEGIEAKEQDLIKTAIKHHGLKKLPDGLNGEHLLFCQLIRDADKLDIYRIILTAYEQYRENPDEFMLELEFLDKPTCTPEIIEDVLSGRRIEYNSLQTLNDMKLLQVGLVYDVNFTATLKRIKKQKYLEQIFELLPQTKQIKKVKEKIFEYVNGRINQDGR